MKNDESYLDMSNGSFVYMKKKLVEKDLILSEQERLIRELRDELEILRKQNIQLLAEKECEFPK